MTDIPERVYRSVLVVRCQGGDRAAFEELVELYQPRLRYFLARMVGDDRANSVLAYLRFGMDGDAPVLVACNLTPVPRRHYRIGVPHGGWYEEVLNTDAQTYGGGNLGNMGGMSADALPWQGRSHSLMIRLPPLAKDLPGLVVGDGTGDDHGPHPAAS